MNPPPLPPENVYRPPASWGEPSPCQFPVAPPSWPKVIGIAAIIIASYGLLSNGAGIFTSKMMGTMMAGGALGKAGFTPGLIASMERFALLNATGGLVLATLLLAAGIVLVRRRPLDRPLILGWAVLRLGLAAVTAPMMFEYMSSMMSSITASIPPLPARVVPGGSGGAVPPASPVSPPVMAGFSSGMAMASVVTSTAMVSLLPVFVLVWFNLRKVKAYVATWPLPENQAPVVPSGPWS